MPGNKELLWKKSYKSIKYSWRYLNITIWCFLKFQNLLLNWFEKRQTEYDKNAVDWDIYVGNDYLSVPQGIPEYLLIQMSNYQYRPKIQK